MTTDRQIKAVAEAIAKYDMCDKPSTHDERKAIAAIAASDAKYVPMLVEALKNMKDEAEGECNSRSDNCGAYQDRGLVCPECPMWVSKEVKRTLAKLPEDLR